MANGSVCWNSQLPNNSNVIQVVTSQHSGLGGIYLRHNDQVFFVEPILSMYGIFSYIYHINQPNVGIYTIHGSYGECLRVVSVPMISLIGGG